MHNIKHNHVLHERNMIVCVNMATRPFVPDGERLQITQLSDRFSRIDMTFGYMEETNVPRALALARKQGEKFDIMSTSFFLNRRTFRPSKTQGAADLAGVALHRPVQVRGQRHRLLPAPHQPGD
jgi:KUP system potassium uptake protein